MEHREHQAAAEDDKAELGAPGAAAPAQLYEAGFDHMCAGRSLEAQLCCQQALALDPDHADTLHLMGLISLQARQYDHAVEWISRAIRREPKPAYLASLGTTLFNQGRREEGLQAFDKAVQLAPDDANLWRHLGSALAEAGRTDEAILSFQQAVKLNPQHWDAAQKGALLLYQASRFEEALGCFTLCNELTPSHFPTIYMRAMTLQNLKRFEEALADNMQAHALDPTHADTCNNIGNVLRSLGRTDEAISWFDRSLALRPDFAATLGNKAVALAELRRIDEAFVCFRRTIEIDPGHGIAMWNFAIWQMLTGNFAAGLAGLEVRWAIPSMAPEYPKFDRLRWLGAEPVAGKSILVFADEGLGDTIQFVRYVPMLAARGARVTLMAQASLHPLLSGLAGVSQCLPRTRNVAQAFDLHCSISSLPLIFGTRIDTVPAATSYLPMPPADRVHAWERHLGPHEKMRVGLVWSGNPQHQNDHNRSVPLTKLRPLLSCNATFVSLQKDPRPDDKATLSGWRDIVDLTDRLDDFVETAALMSCLDLVISVDTSVAHLSGALGRPTWVLLPYTPDYRWLLVCSGRMSTATTLM
jgi:tetratricopeptide (TPR) repeat protein